MKNALFRNIVISDPDKKKSPAPSVSGIGLPAGGAKPLNPQKPKMGVIRNNEATIMTRQMPFDYYTVKRVHVYYMSQEELEKISFSVTNDDKNGILEGTIHDPRMGPLAAKGKLCSSCGLTKSYCPGHLGRINLPEPIIKSSAYPYVIYVLQSVCHHCGSLLLDPEIIKKSHFSSGPERLRQIALKSIGTNTAPGQHCRNVNCKYVGSINPKIPTTPGKMYVIDVIRNGTTYPLRVSKVVEIFDAIPAEDLIVLGFKDILNDEGEVVHKVHPNNFIFQSFPIIPEVHRPTILLDGSEEPDKITTAYRHIVEIVNAIKEQKLTGNAGVGKRKELTMSNLDFAISALLTPGDEKPSVIGLDTSSTIKGKLSKKKGLFRCHAMGKRGNRTGRSVLGSASIPFGFIRMPEAMAKGLTIIEKVCDKNFAFLNKLFLEKKIQFVFNSEGRFDVSKKLNARLEIGNEVWRHLQDGDPVLFNRQPTLHKQCMMGYYVKTSPEMTLGLHSSNTVVHTADFDGDDGNIYVMTSYEARAEIMYLAGCWNHIIASQFSRPVIAIEYNGFVSAYLMSQYGVFTDYLWNEGLSKFNQFRDRIEKTANFPGLLARAARWYTPDKIKCGKVLFSATLPQDFYYSHNKVKIINGILISGIIRKSHIGTGSGSIVHQLYHHYGTNVAARFISECQILLDWFIERRGFSVGYRDCSVDETEAAKIKTIILKNVGTARDKIAEIGPEKDGMTDVELYHREEMIDAALESVKNIGNQIVAEGLSKTNSLFIMSDSGAKGSGTNIAQITGIIGQQFYQGKRPPLKFNVDKYGRGRRFLPYYDVEPKGKVGDILNRGFVETNFGEGMRPGQFFAHMMDSRTGAISRGLGTAKTGHFSRIINKTLEDVRLGYNGTVCKDSGNIIQYVFGGDGYDPKALVETYTPATGMMWSPVDVSTLVAKLNAEVEFPLNF